MTDTPSTTTEPKAPSVVLQGAAPRVFAEGLTNLVLGWPHSRLVFHHAAEPPVAPGQPEVRHAALELTMPTAALVDMAHLLLHAAQQNQEHINRLAAEQTARLNATFAGLPEISLPGRS